MITREQDTQRKSLALVLGGSGFLGGFIIQELLQNNFSVRVVSRTLKNTHDTLGDVAKLTTPESWEPYLEGVDVIINASGILREDDTQTFSDVHLKGPSALAELAGRHGVRFVQLSALGDPTDGAFIASKHVFDEHLLKTHKNALVLRPSVVYATEGAYGGTLLLRALAGCPWRSPLPGQGDYTLQPLSARDLARVIVSGALGKQRGIYELGQKHPLSLRDYQLSWREWLGAKPLKTVSVPIWAIKAHVFLGERFGVGPVNTTIWKMLTRGNTTKPDEHARVLRDFDVDIAPLDQVLLAKSSQTHDIEQARLYLSRDLLMLSMALLFVLSGIFGFMLPPDTVSQLAPSYLSENIFVGLGYFFSGVDLFLGLRLLFLPRKRQQTVLLMFFLTLSYLIGIGVMVPEAFFDPFGGLLKNITLLPSLFILWILTGKR